jgi:hypothetical protein
LGVMGGLLLWCGGITNFWIKQVRVVGGEGEAPPLLGVCVIRLLWG